MKVLSVKHKESGDIEFALIYFNSTIKTKISFKYMLDESFHKILYRIDNWINKESGWVTELIDAEYVNIAIFIPLWRRFYTELPNN